MNKVILGLDIGTNSIGWALIEKNETTGRIIDLGTRIIPLGDDKGNFESGKKLTRNADRRIARGIRKLNHRYKQRRNKLIYALHQMGLLPEQFKLVVGEKFKMQDSIFPLPEKLQHLSIARIDTRTKQLTAFQLVESRKKATEQSINDLKELGRIFYLLNQRRGYAGGGEENEDITNEIDDDNEDKKGFEKYIEVKKVVAVNKLQDETFKARKKGTEEILHRFEIVFEDGERGVTEIQDIKENDEYEFEISETYDKKTGNLKKRILRFPKKTNWRVSLESLEDEIEESGLTLGTFFYHKMKENPSYKIREKIILRKRYQEEFDAIWNKQLALNPAFKKIAEDKDVLQKIVNYIFPGKSESQERYKQEAFSKGLYHLIRNQIIYFQRQLKDQREKIGTCQFERKEKVIPKSHPLYQEFRIWQQINNLTIDVKTTDTKGKTKYHSTFLTKEQRQLLFDTMQNQKELNFSSLFKKLKLRDKVDYLHGLHVKKSLIGNETLLLFKKILGTEIFSFLFKSTLSSYKYLELWRIVFEVYGNEYDLESERVQKLIGFLTENLKDYSFDNGINPKEFIKELATKLAKIKLSRDYGAVSEKALHKILQLMKFDSWKMTDEQFEKVHKLQEGVIDENTEPALVEFYHNYQKAEFDFSNGGLPYWAATSFIYGKHTATKISAENTIKDYHQIKPIEQNSLRNPVVEQILNETLQLIKSLWKHFGFKPSEIRVELARELKNNAKQRKQIFESNIQNEKINKVIRERLNELNRELSLNNIERYKLWETLETDKKIFPEGKPVLSKTPSAAQVERYKLWQEQGQLSPYTGRPIPLSKLFNNGEYEIEHIIPRQRFFDDSFANKTICETWVNKWKDNRTAFEFMKQCGGTQGLLSFDDYEEQIRRHFSGRKMKNFLLEKIPDDFVERQKKDTQYIAIKAREVLGEIVGTNNVKTTTGGITDNLKHEWGLTDSFKRLSRERFIQLAKTLNEPVEKWAREELVENMKGEKERVLKLTNWSKRLDHRHHAIDALVVACTTEAYVKRLNELNKILQERVEEKKEQINTLRKIQEGETTMEAFLQLRNEEKKKILAEYDSLTKLPKPWNSFLADAYAVIDKIVTSYKIKNRLVIDRREWSNGIKKEIKEQVRIRGALHLETNYGLKNGQNTYRVLLTSFAGKSDKAKEGKESAISKAINRIVDENLKRLIKFHFENTYKKDGKAAFSEEGIRALNDRLKIPVESVKLYYSADDGDDVKLQKLDRGFNDSIYVKTGDNYCFAVLKKNNERKFDDISFFDAAVLFSESFRDGNKNIDIVMQQYFGLKHKEYLFEYSLMQDDFVYMPYDDETNASIPKDVYSENYHQFWFDENYKRWKRVYRVVKFSGGLCYFIPHNFSKMIVDKKELGTQNANPYMIEHIPIPAAEKKRNKIPRIQDKCIKLDIDRLGHIQLPKEIHLGNKTVLLQTKR